MSYKVFGEDLRSKISKRKKRIGTFQGMSVLPIWLLCWIYQNRRFYRGWVGKTDKDSLVRPRAVTGLTGDARLQPVGPQQKESTFLPLSFSLLYHFTTITHPNRGAPPPFFSLLPLSKYMEVWRFNQGKASILEAKGSPKANLHFPLRVFWIQLEFFFPKVFKSSFCPISLHGAKIWISFGRTSSEIT
jgi:hypothetical protein